MITRLRVLIKHLLEWRYQPERRGKSWQLTIIEQRDQLDTVLSDSPSLRTRLPEFLAQAYPRAIRAAQQETDFLKPPFPAECPFTLEQILDPDF